jgi:predicted metal-dependent HD superfamily phosphohydrolase
VADDDLELRVAWEQHLGRSPASRRWFGTVVSRYRAAGRHYHDVRHVRWVLRHLAALESQVEGIDDIDAVVAAAFFHDVIYDPARSDNEAASARLADVALDELGWEPRRRRRTMAMIDATVTHDVDGADLDTQVLLAADLAVLAAEPARYSDYVTAVRREYAHVGDEDWRSGRTHVLHRLLERGHLFAPGLGLEDWEHRARANITAELATLQV